MKHLTFIRQQEIEGGICTAFPGNTDNHPFGECFSLCFFTMEMSGGAVPWDACIL